MDAQTAAAPQREQLIFDSSMDGLVRAVKADLTPQAKKRLKDLGIDVDAKLLPGYPARQWAEMVRLLGEELFQGLDPLEAQRRLAHRTVDAFSQGVIGSAMFGVCRLVGPDRTIGRMTKNLRTGSNFVETRATEVGPHEYEIWINDVSGVSGFYMGLIEQGLKHIGAKNVRMFIKKSEGRSCSFTVGWDGS